MQKARKNTATCTTLILNKYIYICIHIYSSSFHVHMYILWIFMYSDSVCRIYTNKYQKSMYYTCYIIITYIPNLLEFQRPQATPIWFKTCFRSRPNYELVLASGRLGADSDLLCDRSGGKPYGVVDTASWTLR